MIFETQSSPGVVYADYSCQLTHFIRCNLLKTFISLVSKLARQDLLLYLISSSFQTGSDGKFESWMVVELKGWQWQYFKLLA